MSLVEQYLTTSKNLEAFLNTIINTQAPQKVTQKFIGSPGFKSTNDRLFIGLLRGIGFTDSNGVLQSSYYRFLDQSKSKYVLADAIKDAYSDLFAINKQANLISASDVKNKLKTLFQGRKSDKGLEAMANTFVDLCKLEELPKAINEQQQIGDDEQNLSSVKDTVSETTKTQSQEIKDLSAKQWKVYAQLSTVLLQQPDTIKKSQEEEQGVQQEPQPLEHTHRHSFDIKSSKTFSFVVGLGMVCTLSLRSNIEQWQSKRQDADDTLKFRAIRSWGGCTANDMLRLNKVFEIHRDKKAIEWVRKQANGYKTSLEAVSDSLMQESIKSKSD